MHIMLRSASQTAQRLDRSGASRPFPLPSAHSTLRSISAGALPDRLRTASRRREMTQLLDVANMARWIQRDGAERILVRMTEYLKQDFRRWEKFDKVPRIASHTPLGVIELMPTSDGELYSFKYVNGHPSNPARGFQTVTAFGVL